MCSRSRPWTGGKAPGAEITAVTSLICLILHSQSSALRLAGRRAEIDIFQCVRKPEHLLLWGPCGVAICLSDCSKSHSQNQSSWNITNKWVPPKKNKKNKAFFFLQDSSVTITGSEDSALISWSKICYDWSRFQDQLTDSITIAGCWDSGPLRWRPIGCLHSHSNVSDEGKHSCKW